MAKPLISVIVPVYMIDRYLGICIESILQQTYRNLEILLVDDGGGDRCPEICDLYGRKDGRIRVIHKPNGGLVSARKAGLRESNGEYVGYVDGDDWIGPGFIDALYTAIRTTGADMACAGHCRDLFSRSVHFVNALPPGVYEGKRLEELWRTMLSRGAFYRPGISTYVWNKLFKRELLFDLQMSVDNRITIGEDGAVTYPALLKSRRVVISENTAYHYRQREDSMLKQSASFVNDAIRLKYLYEYLMKWAKGSPGFDLEGQVVDYVLSIALIRSGGRLPHGDYSTFDAAYYGKNVVVYSAGTFGQQLVNRFRETGHCNVVSWIDDDYWEYRRCCMDVDPVESVADTAFDYVLVATVDAELARNVIVRLQDLGVERKRILTVTVPNERKGLLDRFLDIESLREEERKRERRFLSHA